MTTTPRPATEATPVVVLSFPTTPDRSLTPNRTKGKHWRRISPARKAERDAVCWVVKGDHQGRYGPHGRPDPLTGPLRVEVVIRWGKAWMVGEKRARYEQVRPVDQDAAAALMKAWFDGITDAGTVWLDDRQIRTLVVRQGIDESGHGETIISITTEESPR